MSRSGMSLVRLAGLVAAAVALLALSACVDPVKPAVTGAVPAAQQATATPASGSGESTQQPASTANDGKDTATVSSEPTKAPEKPAATKPAATVNRASAAAALKKAFNTSLGAGAGADVKAKSVDIKVLEKASNGTWWAGGEIVNDLDGGIIFAKKTPGGSWVIIDSGTGIDGSELKGKAPSAIAAKFAAAFPQ